MSKLTKNGLHLSSLLFNSSVVSSTSLIFFAHQKRRAVSKSKDSFFNLLHQSYLRNLIQLSLLYHYLVCLCGRTIICISLILILYFKTQICHENQAFYKPLKLTVSQILLYRIRTHLRRVPYHPYFAQFRSTVMANSYSI